MLAAARVFSVVFYFCLRSRADMLVLTSAWDLELSGSSCLGSRTPITSVHPEPFISIHSSLMKYRLDQKQKIYYEHTCNDIIE
jgi:hypothetical protein